MLKNILSRSKKSQYISKRHSCNKNSTCTEDFKQQFALKSTFRLQSANYKKNIKGHTKPCVPFVNSNYLDRILLHYHLFYTRFKNN